MSEERTLKDEELNKVSGGTNTSPEQAIRAINLAISNNDPATARQLYKLYSSILSTQEQNQLITNFAKKFNNASIQSNN